MLLYKYFRPYQARNSDRIIVEDLLTRLLIRFTQPSEFDDPFDCLPQIQGYENAEYLRRLFQETAAKFRKNHHFDQLPVEERIFRDGRLGDLQEQKVQLDVSHPEKWQDAHLNWITTHLYQDIGILCLTARPDDILMWSHYAEKHTGFVIGFETETDFFARRSHEPIEIGELRKVNYSKNRPTVHVPFTEASPDVDIFFTKNEDWRYQAEWRIVRLLRDAHSQPKPGVYLFSIPPDCIREIIFGNNAEKTKEPSIEPIIEIIKSNPALRNIKIKKARLSRGKFLLDISDSLV